MSDAIFNTEKAFQIIQQQLQEIRRIQGEQTETLKTHTGYFAEQSVTLKRLDDERLSAVQRMDRIESDVEQLKTQLA